DVPADVEQARAWAERAGVIASHRELTGHDDVAEPLGPAPKPGQVEAYASWRAAWRALGRPEDRRDELEMSDGQLRMRIRAADREAAWAPRYVGNELAGTLQTAEQHRQTAAVRTAEADGATHADYTAERRQLADEAAALADTLDERAAQLQALDDARAQWLAHTAETREAGERAQVALQARHADDDPTAGNTVTAEEWLAAHHEAAAAEDPYREITSEHELADVGRDQAADLAAAGAEPPDAAGDDTPCTAARAAEAVDAAAPDDLTAHSTPAVTAEEDGAAAEDRTVTDESTTATGTEPEVAPQQPVEPEPAESTPADLREIATDEPAQVDEDEVRVPDADETAEAVARAQRALAEIAERQATDEARKAEEERSAQLAQWHSDDQTAEHAREAEQDATELDVAGAL
ncbi:MAG: hypothetical protein ACRDO8_11565, partial [Nocardioidaceae bacterium]